MDLGFIVVLQYWPLAIHFATYDQNCDHKELKSIYNGGK